MNLQLTQEDRHAVDLLLDRAATASGTGNGDGAHSVYAGQDPSLAGRIARASKLLHLLDALRPADPPADLVDRTIRFVEDASEPHKAVSPVLPSLIGSQRPVA